MCSWEDNDTYVESLGGKELMTPEALPRNHSLGELQDNVSQDSSNTKHNTTYIPQSFNSLAPIRNG